MIIVAAIEAAGLLVLAGALVAVVYMFIAAQAATDTAIADERRELLNRIQRPEQLPVAAMPAFVFPEPVEDEIGLVGTIAEPSVDE